MQGSGDVTVTVESCSTGADTSGAAAADKLVGVCRGKSVKTRAIPHNSKYRYGERGAADAKPKAQIILDVLSSTLATQMPYRTPSRSEALRSATAACGGSWRGDPPERCLSRQAGIVRYCPRLFAAADLRSVQKRAVVR